MLKKTSILKILEKKSTGLELQSRLFTEIDNNHIINIIEQNENNNSTNKKKRKLSSICSKLINYTPGAGNKCESKIINRIPKGNFNLSKINKIDSHIDMEVKNLDNLFQQSMDTSGQEIKSPRKKNKNKSDLPITRNLNKMHKAISSKDIRNQKDNNFLYSDLIAERINKNVKKNSVLNINKPSKTPISSRDIISNSKNDISSNQKKNNEGPIRQLFTKLKKYNSQVNECGDSEIVKIIKNIRQYQDTKNSRKKSANFSGAASIEKENFEIKRQLSKKNRPIELSKNIFEKEINKIKMLKDFNVSDYKIIKQIGQGSYGQILLVEDTHHQKYALKKIIGSSESEIKSLKQEYQILFDIQSNLNENKTDINIVNIYGLSTKKLDPTTYVMYVLMELGNMDWENEILSRQKQKQYYSEKELMNILYALVKTLAQLQKENISHRDIKPQNILVFTNNNNKCYKLADFGEAKELISGNKPTEKQTLRGTELYMSPLLFYGLRSRKIKKYIKHNPYKSDVFSLGLCTLFAATLCFESLYDVRELQNNVSVKIVIEKYLKKRYSYKLITIINSMLDINETTRDDFIELKKKIENIQN